MAQHPATPIPVLMVVFGALCLWAFGYETVGDRWRLDVRGTVAESRYEPGPDGTSARHDTRYVFRAPDGRLFRYVAGPSDAALARDLAVGAVVEKRPGQLGYAVDGRWRPFPVGFYLTVKLVGLGLVLGGAAWWAVRRRRG